MDNLSKVEQDKLPQLIKKYKTDKEYFDFIINRGNSLMTNGEIQYCSYSKIKDAEDYLAWLALFYRY